MAKEKAVSPRISESSHAFYGKTFDNVHQGTYFVLEMFPAVYGLTLARELKGKFTAGELMLMIDVNNGLFLTPQISGQHMDIQVADGCSLDRLDEKWKVDAKKMSKKIGELTLFQGACLEIWSRAFWESGEWEGHGDALKKYVEALL